MKHCDPKTIKNKRAHYRVSNKLYESIDNLCLKDGITKSQLIYDAIRDYKVEQRGGFMEKIERNQVKQNEKGRQIHIRLNNDTYQRIKSAASELELSMNSYISLALAAYVACSEQTEQLDHLQQEVASHSKRLTAIESIISP